MSIFDRIFIGTVGLAALVQALQQALKDAPAIQPAFPILDTREWAYVSFALFAFGCSTWLFGRLRSKWKLAPSSNALLAKAQPSEQPMPRQPNAAEASQPDDLSLGAARAVTKSGPAKDIADSWFKVADLVDDLGRAHGFEPPRPNSPVVQIHLMGRGILPPSLGETISSLQRLRDGALANPEAISRSHADAYEGVAQATIRSLTDLFPKAPTKQ